MAAVDICKHCGGPVTGGRCLRCESQWKYRLVHREVVILAVLVGVTVAAFIGTRRFAAANQALRLQDAKAWYASGEQALHRGDLSAALASLRRATGKDPNDPIYSLALARTLMADHQDESALQLLLGLREQQADDPETNLQLARLEARRGDVTAAGRYYQNALSALWKPEQRESQRQIRTEFIQLLLGHGERDRALSQLLVLEAAIPDDGPSQLAAGRMLLSAGDARRAATHFARALALDPNDQAALAGAGEASFELGDYARAHRYLSQLADLTDRASELRTVTGLVLSNDPLAPRLPMSERRRRLAAGAAQVIRRLEACQSRTSAERLDPRVDLNPLLVEARGLETALSGRKPPSTSDQIEAGFDLVYRGERAVERACGSPEPLDQALLLTGRHYGLEEP